MKSYYQKINYSSCNEDSSSELRALRIQKTDRVLCITGSGARPLDLLIAEPAEIVAIDFNPCQNHLLELKMRAIEVLDYQEHLAFIGISPSDSRIEMYQKLRLGLSEEARRFWDGRPRIILKGVIYQGGWERFFKRLAVFIRCVRPGLLEELFSPIPIGRQARLWTDVWNSGEWKIFLRLVTHRAIWKYILRDPGFYRYVPKSFSVYDYLEKRFDHAFKTLSLHQSAFASLLFFGRFNGALPPYLQEKNHEVLRKNLRKVHRVTCSLAEFLDRSGDHTFDKYSLSDFSSYTDEAEYNRIWRGILSTANPGARVCERQFLVKRSLPRSIEPHARRDEALDRELEESDNSIFFSFITAEVGSIGNE